MENQEHPKFIYPIPFDNFVNYQKDYRQERQESIPKLHELHKLKKLKRMLEQTQHRIQNRIKLFKKVSNQITKKKQKQKEQTQKLQAIRSHPFFAVRKTQNSSFQKQKMKTECIKKKYLNTITEKDHQISLENKQNQNKKIKNVHQQKIFKARNIKMEKMRYKMLIDENKNKELRKKMQSAGFIRKQRGKAKEIKQQMQKQRKISIRRQRQQKYFQQQEQYDELKRNLTKLQLQQREALISWKKTIEQ